jgi:hypothetical protein
VSAIDPIPIADDLCEILHDADWAQQRAQLTRIVRAAGDALGDVLAEVARQGFLERLLPTSPSVESADAIAALLAGIVNEQGAALLADAWCARGGDYDRGALDRLIGQAEGGAYLAPLFAHLIDGGRYDALRTLLTSDGTVDSPSLRALAAARPSYDEATLNAPAQKALRTVAAATPYDAIIVPGYTPVGSAKPMRLIDLPPACRRLDLAIADLSAGKARVLLVSGGNVHPPGTPYNEALSMRDYAIGKQVDPAKILVDPYARHSTTNLRNAGRMMRDLGLSRGLITTGFDEPMFDQAFYFGEEYLSTFADRCQEDLGYLVGDLTSIDAHHIAFKPAPEVATVDYRDPLDA